MTDVGGLQKHFSSTILRFSYLIHPSSIRVHLPSLCILRHLSLLSLRMYLFIT